MNTLILTVGLPRSGKSTWSADMACRRWCVVVSPDAVRLTLHGRRFVQEAEGFVWATVRVMVDALFLAGHQRVILDSVNVTRKGRDSWRCSRWQTLCVEFPVPADECRRRAVATGQPDLLPVIERMAGQFEPLGDDEVRYVPEDLR